MKITKGEREREEKKKGEYIPNSNKRKKNRFYFPEEKRNKIRTCKL